MKPSHGPEGPVRAKLIVQRDHRPVLTTFSCLSNFFGWVRSTPTPSPTFKNDVMCLEGINFPVLSKELNRYKIYFFGDCSHRMWLFWCTIWWFKGRSCIAWLKLLSSYIYDFVILVGIALNLLRTCPMIRYKRFCHLLTWCSWSKAVYVNFTIGKKMWLKWIRDLKFFVMKYI